jgi:hypothetical protein
LRSQPTSRRKVLVATGLAAAVSSALLVSSVGTAHAAGSTSSHSSTSSKTSHSKSKVGHYWRKATSRTYRQQWRHDRAMSAEATQAADDATRDQVRKEIGKAQAQAEKQRVDFRVVVRGRDAKDPYQIVELWISTKHSSPARTSLGQHYPAEPASIRLTKAWTRPLQAKTYKWYTPEFRLPKLENLPGTDWEAHLTQMTHLQTFTTTDGGK